jgi:hypothetical protein
VRLDAERLRRGNELAGVGASSAGAWIHDQQAVH